MSLGFCLIKYSRYFRELKRLNFVTPTSYLALITTFKSLLQGKREEILNLKTRYEMGLGKLEFASSQVNQKITVSADGCRSERTSSF